MFLGFLPDGGFIFLILPSLFRIILEPTGTLVLGPVVGVLGFLTVGTEAIFTLAGLVDAAGLVGADVLGGLVFVVGLVI